MFLICPSTKSYFRREIFPSHVKLFVQNDAVAALASGTMGKLHGCVLIAGTGTIAYGFTDDGREARAAGAGPILGDWGRLVCSFRSLDTHIHLCEKKNKKLFAFNAQKGMIHVACYLGWHVVI